MRQGAKEALEVLVRARYSLVYVVSWEEQRVLSVVEEVAERLRKKVIRWSVTEGMEGEADAAPGDEEARALAALDYVIKSYEPALFVLLDFHPYLKSPKVVRRLREVARELKATHKTVVLVSPVLELPRELEKDITVLDFELPGMEELAGLVEGILVSVRQSAGLQVELDEQQREEVVKAALGLTLTEAENVFAKSLVMARRLDADIVRSEKEQIIRKTGILEFYRTDAGLEDVGGLGLVKEWVRKRRKAFSEEARAYGLPAPRGVLLLGVQGCGKSLCAKTVAREWRLPLLRFDVGRIFAGIVGESEANMRRAIQLAEGISPCVLWVDELEKGFAGTQSSAASDAGTTARVFGTFITWLQEKEKPVFVIATANDIRQLPAELLRKGRFDEIFFVDLPSRGEREEIFRIHLRKRGRDPERFDVELLARAAKGFSGAEIEQAVIGGMFDAFDEGREVTTGDILRNIEQTYPLSRTMSAQIGMLREWARTRARRASAEVTEEVEEAQRGGTLEAIETMMGAMEEERVTVGVDE
ncbi:MAG TPA: AAA family ATPase [Armatimonadetes bacterium]|nr:AAA family ATPase [Armatimonadota bacterium]